MSRHNHSSGACFDAATYSDHLTRQAFYEAALLVAVAGHLDKATKRRTVLALIESAIEAGASRSLAAIVKSEVLKDWTKGRVAGVIQRFLDSRKPNRKVRPAQPPRRQSCST
jgi:hypothetical protein